MGGKKPHYTTRMVQNRKCLHDGTSVLKEISLRLTTLKIEILLDRIFKTACTNFIHQVKSGLGKGYSI
jgi:hypothetical protein